MNQPAHAVIHIDGGSRGNPGPASFAIVLERVGLEPVEICETIGQTTNNIAEYTALVKSLELAQELGCQSLLIHSDSELLVKQMNGEYKVKSDDLRPLFEQAQSLRRRFDHVELVHIRREYNKRADQLCNLALDGQPRPWNIQQDQSLRAGLSPEQQALDLLREIAAREVSIEELRLAWQKLKLLAQN